MPLLDVRCDIERLYALTAFDIIRVLLIYSLVDFCVLYVYIVYSVLGRRFFH